MIILALSFRVYSKDRLHKKKHTFITNKFYIFDIAGHLYTCINIILKILLF